VRVRIEFKPQDLWLGLYWKVDPHYYNEKRDGEWVDVWVCLIPMLPIHIDWPRGVKYK